MAVVQIASNRIVDWASFHDVFAESMGFPSWYGRNSGAWMDLMLYADKKNTGGTTIRLKPGETLTLNLGDVTELRRRQPEILAAIYEWSAWVNSNRLDAEEPALILIAASSQD